MPFVASLLKSIASLPSKITSKTQLKGLYITLAVLVAFVFVAISQLFMPPPIGVPDTPEVFFSVTHNDSSVQDPGVAKLVFTFTKIPSDFYVDKVLLQVVEAGFDIPISENPSRQLKPVTVSKIVSATELEILPASILIDANFFHDPGEPVAKLVVLLSYNEIQFLRKLLITPTFLDASGSPISLSIQPSKQWIEVGNFPHILATEK